MIKPSSLIVLFQKALNEKWGYIWGATGGTWTQAKQNAATREMTKKYGQKWVGRRVADCSGLFYWAFKELGGHMYHGSNTMFKSYSTSSGKLTNGKRSDGQELKPGSAVYKYNSTDGYHHVGLYIGDGVTIEAKGTQYGVVKGKVSDWSHWSELQGVDYTGQANVPLSGNAIVTPATSSTVRMRKSPSTSAEILYNVPKDTVVNVVADDGEWCKIEVKQEGYMMKRFLKGVETSG